MQRQLRSYLLGYSYIFQKEFSPLKPKVLTLLEAPMSVTDCRLLFLSQTSGFPHSMLEHLPCLMPLYSWSFPFPWVCFLFFFVVSLPFFHTVSSPAECELELLAALPLLDSRLVYHLGRELPPVPATPGRPKGCLGVLPGVGYPQKERWDWSRYLMFCTNRTKRQSPPQRVYNPL